MTPRRVEPGRGWGWITEGWGLFVKSPGLWIGMILIYFLINLVLSLIPVLGSLASTVITPALMGGMIYGAAALDRGHSLEVGQLFYAFQHKERLTPMLMLGAFLLLASLVAGAVAGFLIAGGMPTGGPMMEPGNGHMMGPPDERPGGIFAVGPFAFLVIFLIILAIAMTMFYAVPLVMLGGVAPLQAIQTSVSACMLNIMPFLVFVFACVVLGFLAALPFGLGFLVLGPVTFGAVYASYRDVFAEQAAWRLAPPARGSAAEG